METKVKKCTSPGRAQRYVNRMMAKGWRLAGPVERSGIINKRYLVTLTRDAEAPAEGGGGSS